MISIFYKMGVFVVIIHIYVGTIVDQDIRSGGDGDTRKKKYQQTIYVSWVWVCVRVQAFLRGGVGKIDRGWYIRSISERTTSGKS